MSAASDVGQISFDTPETETATAQNGSPAPTISTSAAALENLPPQHQPHNPSLNLHPRQGAIDFMRRVCHILWKLPGLILDQKLIEAARIEVTDLNIDDGKPCDGGDQFIKVLPFKRVEDILEEGKPWLHYDLEEPDPDLCQWWSAFSVIGTLGQWLHYTQYSNEEASDEEASNEGSRPMPLYKTVQWWKGSRSVSSYLFETTWGSSSNSYFAF